MTAPQPTPGSDGEVCQPEQHPESGCDALGHGPHRPAAPSEPPAADSPTPGTETWVSPFPPFGTTPPPRLAAPSPVDTTEHPAEGCDQCTLSVPHYHAKLMTGPAFSAPPEPPAETQQADKRPRWIDGEMAEPWHRDLVAGTIAQNAADPIAWAERVATTYGRSGSLEITAVIWALLDQLDAARPSADTETLLASVLRKLMAADSFLALSTHRSATGVPVQFTLDDTSIEVTDAEADAIKATVGW